MGGADDSPREWIDVVVGSQSTELVENLRRRV